MVPRVWSALYLTPFFSTEPSLDKMVRWMGQTRGLPDQDKTLDLTKQDHTAQSTESGPTQSGLETQ